MKREECPGCEDSECQDCCDHDDCDDHCCLNCGKEMTEDRMAEAYDRAKALRRDG